jgi:hypothetical protein
MISSVPLSLRNFPVSLIIQCDSKLLQ